MDSIPELSSDHNPVFLNFSLTLPIHQDNARAVTTCWSDFRNNLKSSVRLSDFSGIRNPNVLEDKSKWHVIYGVPVPERDVPPHQNFRIKSRINGFT
ncbi:hypothetical protein TNCV_3922341 [Trichonephila clavipes]|nr:hypothetical protein TNCV_3922341 [Trichonephila clavipes]